ncbi:hypothetical protein SCHPADRAFT_898373, partial [Schizopora paradoxa]
MDTTTSATAKFQQKYSLQTIHQVSSSFAALHSTRLRRLHLSQPDEESIGSEPSSSTLQSRSLWEQVPLQCTHCGHLGGITTRLVHIRGGRTKQKSQDLQNKSSGESKKEGPRNRGRRCIRRSCGICGHVDDDLICSEQERGLKFPSTRSRRYNAAVGMTTISPPQCRVEDTRTVPTPQVAKADVVKIPASRSSTPSSEKSAQPPPSREPGNRKSSKGKKSGLQEMLQRAREKKAAESDVGGGLASFLGGL